MSNFQNYLLKANFEHKLFIPQLFYVLRDHPDNDRFEFGFEGGRKLLQFYLAENEHRLAIDNARRGALKRFFKIMDCILLPNPGKTVARSKIYNGNFREIDNDFSSVMEQLFNSIFQPDKICTKFIGNGFLNGFNLIKIIQKICESETDNVNILPVIATETAPIIFVEQSDSSSARLPFALSSAKTIPADLTQKRGATFSQKSVSATLELARRQESYNAQYEKTKQEMQLITDKLSAALKENSELRKKIEIFEMHSKNDKMEIANLTLKLNHIESQSCKKSSKGWCHSILPGKSSQ